jgi:hypothetical protein
VKITGKAFRGLSMLLSLFRFCPQSTGAGFASEPNLKITIFVYNYAAVTPDVLAETEAEAARICHHGGIEIKWLDCPLAPKDADQFPNCQVPPGPTSLALRILSQAMADRLRQADDSFGFAMIPEDGSFATIANVFSNDAEQLADRRGMRHGVILGHLAAHELGHLLLGAGSHSSRGIMYVPWGLKELDIIAQGLMMFTPREAERMRRNIRARTRAEAAAEAGARCSIMTGLSERMRGVSNECRLPNPASFYRCGEITTSRQRPDNWRQQPISPGSLSSTTGFLEPCRITR